MNRPIPALLAIALLGTAGCAVGPDYARPAMPQQPAWKEAAVAEPVTVLPGDWWRLFEDAELDTLVGQALDANQELRLAMARVLEARALAGVSTAELFPSLTANNTYTEQRLSENTADAPQQVPGGPAPDHRVSDFRTTLDLSYEVDVWGRVRRLVEAADHDTRVVETDLQVVRLTLAADVARTYHELRALDVQRDVLSGTVTLRREASHLQKTRHAAGLITEVDVTRAETELANVEADLHAIVRTRARQEHALAVLCGQPVGGFTITAKRTAMPLPQVPAGLPATLLERRPDVVAAEERLKAASARIGVAEAAFLPTIRLTGAVGSASEDLGNLLEWPSRIWAFGPSITIPLFEGGRNRANLNAARARYEQAVASYRGTVLHAFREVEDALSDVGALAAQHQAVTRSLTAARATATLANERYQKGLSTYLEVVDAERGALQAERQEAEVRSDRAVATVLLIKALGGGWQPPVVAQSR